MKTNRKFDRMWMAFVIGGLLVTATSESVVAQTDTVNLFSGPRVRGTVESFTNDNIVVNTTDGRKDVKPWNVRMIRFEGSNELVKAKSAYDDERYSACYTELENIEMPSRDVMKQEVAFFKAMAATRLALRGGNVTTDQAAKLVREFIDGYPQSYHLVEAIDAFGDLAIATGRFDVAISQFERTAASDWPELSFRGNLKSGKALLYSGKYAEAIQAFQATEAADNGEDYAVQAKLIARCLRAQAMGLGGNAEEGQQVVLGIIKNENSKNIELFAHAYNALGACYAAENKTKEAIRAYLHTDLLFTIDPDSHAQALYHLVDLWKTSERPDRSARARQKLTERYRNTYWAAKITGG